MLRRPSSGFRQDSQIHVEGEWMEMRPKDAAALKLLSPRNRLRLVIFDPAQAYPDIGSSSSLQSEACPATGAGEGHCGDIAAELERDLAAPDNCLWPATDGPLVLARHRWPVMAMLVLAVRNRIPDIHTGNRRLCVFTLRSRSS